MTADIPAVVCEWRLVRRTWRFFQVDISSGAHHFRDTGTCLHCQLVHPVMFASTDNLWS